MFQSRVLGYREVKLVLCLVHSEDLILHHYCGSRSIKEELQLLNHFEQATREISSDEYIFLSKVIPLARSLQSLTQLILPQYL